MQSWGWGGSVWWWHKLGQRPSSTSEFRCLTMKYWGEKGRRARTTKFHGCFGYFACGWWEAGFGKMESRSSYLLWGVHGRVWRSRSRPMGRHGPDFLLFGKFFIFIYFNYYMTKINK